MKLPILLTFAGALASSTVLAYEQPDPVLSEVKGYWKGINTDLSIITSYVAPTGVFRMIGDNGCLSDGRIYDDGSRRLLRYSTKMRDCGIMDGEYTGQMTFYKDRECRDSAVYGNGVLQLNIVVNDVPVDIRFCRSAAKDELAKAL